MARLAHLSILLLALCTTVSFANILDPESDDASAAAPLNEMHAQAEGEGEEDSFWDFV